MTAYEWTDGDLAKVAAMVRADRNWNDVGAVYGITGNAARKRWRRSVDEGRVALALGEVPDVVAAPDARVSGVVAADSELPDPSAIWERHERGFERVMRTRERRNGNEVTFERGPVCIVFIGDVHCGARGVDYPLARRHALTIRDTPGMFLVGVGDLLDNFVHGWAIKIRLQTETTIPEEWALVRQWLGWVAPKLLASVDGNHDAWTRSLAGIDYFQETVAAARPGSLYARDDLRFTLNVGAASWPVRVRHKWRGHSQWNPTHAVEKAQKWDHDFLIGVGGHVHTGAFFRTFNAAGRTAAAIQVNTYKREDRYAEAGGFPKSNTDVPVAVIFHESGAVAGTTDLELAAELMRLYYARAEAA